METLEESLIMEDSEFVFKELGDTAEIMERGGL